MNGLPEYLRAQYGVCWALRKEGKCRCRYLISRNEMQDHEQYGCEHYEITTAKTWEQLKEWNRGIEKGLRR